MAELFNIDFEAGDFSELDDSTGGAELYVSATGAISGSFSCNHDWSASAQVVANGTSISLPFTVFRVGHRIKIKAGFDLGTASDADYFNFLNGTNHYTFQVVKSGSDHVAEFHSTSDPGGSQTITGSIKLDDGNAHTVEMRAVRGAPTGVEALYVDGILEGQLTGLDNDSEFSAIRVGINNWQWRQLVLSGSGLTGIITDDWILRDDDTQIYPAAAADEFDTGRLTARPVDIDADGTFIYIAVLDSLSEPGLIKFSTAINIDGTRVFEPGIGTDIGVQCGRFDVDTVWIAGDFGGTDTVEKSEDSGSTFTVKDPGTFGVVSAFAVGPDSDERVLVIDTGVDIQETIDDGTEWIAKNIDLTPVTKSLARLDINVEEVIFGNESGANDNVDYSINTGADLEDLNLPVAADVLGVIVN